MVREVRLSLPPAFPAVGGMEGDSLVTGGTGYTSKQNYEKSAVRRKEERRKGWLPYHYTVQ